MINRIFRFFVKLVLVIFGLIFAISMLIAALFVVLLSLLKSLITGKKSSSVMVFNRFKKFSPSITWSSASTSASRQHEGNLHTPSTGEIVDVEVREIKDVNNLKDDSKQDAQSFKS